MFRTESPKTLLLQKQTCQIGIWGKYPPPPRSWIQPIDHLKLWKVDTWLINKTIDFKRDKI